MYTVFWIAKTCNFYCSLEMEPPQVDGNSKIDGAIIFTKARVYNMIDKNLILYEFKNDIKPQINRFICIINFVILG